MSASLKYPLTRPSPDLLRVGLDGQLRYATGESVRGLSWSSGMKEDVLKSKASGLLPFFGRCLVVATSVDGGG